MATKILPTPSINAIVPFDPSMEYIINFIYLGDQIVKNRAVITHNETSEIVYDKIQDNMKLEHLLPANSLIAGNQYIVQIEVYDIDGNKSELSTPTLFYCLSTPIFKFENITEGTTYKNASILLNLNYMQTENEPIKSFQFFKYSIDKTLLESSNIYYSTSALSHSFYGLDNNSVYYFRATGETNRGIIVDTGYILVNIVFDTIPLNIILNANNNYKEGYVSLSLNLKSIDYELSNNNYELKDGLLILKNNSLLYENFTIENNFSLFIEAKELPVKRFFTTNDEIFSLSIIKICDIYYCKLEVKDSIFTQYIPLQNALLNSNGYVEIIDDTIGDDVLIGISVKRINGYYGLEIYYKQNEYEEENS